MAIMVNGQRLVDLTRKMQQSRTGTAYIPKGPAGEVYCPRCEQFTATCSIGACGSRQAVLERRLAREGRPAPINYTGADVRELLEAVA